MFEPNKPSSVVESNNWLTVLAVGAMVASSSATATDFNEQYQRVVPNEETSRSPWAGTFPPVSQANTPHIIEFANWYDELSNRIAQLSKKPNGWKGPDSLGPTPDALDYAERLLRKFAIEGIDHRPTVGLDYEGTFSFSWSHNHLHADLTIYSDGTYSYFASDGKKSATEDDARVSDKIPNSLLGILLG